MRSVEISIKEILVYILNKWVSILLCAVAVAGVLGGYSFIKLPRGEKLQRILDQNQASKAAISQSIDRISKNIVDIRSSIDNTSSSDIHFTNKRIFKMAVDISSNDSDVDIKRLRNTYLNVYKEMTLKDILDPITDGLYTEADLKKLVNTFSQDVNGSPSRFMIGAVGGDEIDPVFIVNAILDAFISKHDYFVRRVGEHEILPTSFMSVAAANNDSLFTDEINKKMESINDYESQLVELNKRLGEIDDTSHQAVKIVLNQIVFGAILGSIIGIIISAFIYVYRIPIVISYQVQQRLHIRYLGGVRQKKGWFLRGLADKIAGNFMLWSDTKSAVDYIAANLAELIKTEATVLITGSIPREDIMQFSEELQKNNLMKNVIFLVRGDVTINPDTIAALPKADHIVIVERLGESTIKRVNEEMNAILDIAGKQVDGYVLA